MSHIEFQCPHWRRGETCKPHFPPPKYVRVVLTGAGTLVGSASPLFKFIDSVSGGAVALGHGPLAATIGWAAILIGVMVGGFVFTFEHENHPLACFITAFGFPGLVTLGLHAASLAASV